MLNESVKPASVLTEEELLIAEETMEFAKMSFSFGAEVDITAEFVDSILNIIASHRSLNSRNAKLVHENDELMAQVERLKWICQRSSDFIDAMVGFTGQNLSVFNWHQNGDGEPFDNFVEENLEENLITDLKTALEGLNHE